jgi:hypothetical protein
MQMTGKQQFKQVVKWNAITLAAWVRSKKGLSCACELAVLKGGPISRDVIGNTETASFERATFIGDRRRRSAEKKTSPNLTNLGLRVYRKHLA